MLSLDQIAAFTEYVARPMTEDIRLILDRVKELNLPITEEMVKKTAIAIGIWHIIGELIRAVTYVAITWIICQTVMVALWT